MEENNDIEKQIELKKLEIEKLKLEKELNLARTPDVKSSNPVKIDAGKYPDLIALNIFFLLAAGVSFYFLPWGRLGADLHSSFGNQTYLSNSFTGFNLGLFTYSYPLTILNVVLLIFIFSNSLKTVGIISLIAFIVALIAVFNVNQVVDLHTNISNSFSSVSSGFQPTGWPLILPVVYFLLFISNITQKKSATIAYEQIIQNHRDIEAEKRAQEKFEEQELKNQLENSKHYIDGIKYMLNIRIELIVSIALLLTSYFLAKDNQYIDPMLPVFSIFLLILGILLVINIVTQFLLADTFVKTSLNIVIFKLCFYSVFLIAVLTNLFNQIFFDYVVLLPKESYLVAGYLSLLTIILVTVINEKKAIKLNVNSNAEKS